MTMSTEETERPGEWLLRFQEDAARYIELVGDGGLHAAAYRMARARCRSAPLSSLVPTLHELWAAAFDIARHVGLTPPKRHDLYDDCRRAGLLVIG